MSDQAFGEAVRWEPERPKLHVLRLLAAWAITTVAVIVAAKVTPGVTLADPTSALFVPIVIALVNAVITPLVAALRLPFTLVLGLLLVLIVDAGALIAADRLLEEMIDVESFAAALWAALVISAVAIVLEVLAGTNDDSAYRLRVIERVARRQGAVARTDTPGIVFLEIDGLALGILRRAMRDGSAPEMARWVADHGYELTGWEPDLSSQTGASQAGILHGSNDCIPAFRWVEKETGTVVACSSPGDCAAIERRISTGDGLLRSGGASRGNLLSGEADEAILTVSRARSEMRSNPGYRAFFANGFNVSRTLALVGWELLLEWTAALRARRRDVRPRGHRGGIYPFLRAFMCVFVRDLVVFGVLTDMMRGRPAVYATFASYDEVAHHSGLERADTLEALRKVDQQFGRIAAARRFAPRPYEIVVLSDHGQTQGATFRQRNGYALEDLVKEALGGAAVSAYTGGDEQRAMARIAVSEATGSSAADAAGESGEEPGGEAIVLGSGNLGLIYLMESRERMTREQIDAAHPRLLAALRDHPHVGWVMVRSAGDGAVVLGADGAEHRLVSGEVDGVDPLAVFGANAPRHLIRSDGFSNAPDIWVGSFYDPELDEGCAFEELISFHGGLGGPQTEPFILHPRSLPVSGDPIIGAAQVHAVLCGWRAQLQG